jgi:hypothetical protein
MFIATLFYDGQTFTIKSYLRNLIVLICVIHRTDEPANRPV